MTDYGANHLASTTLLEGLVWGSLAAGDVIIELINYPQTSGQDSQS